MTIRCIYSNHRGAWPFFEQTPARACVPLDQYRFVSNTMELYDIIQQRDVKMLFHIHDYERVEGLYTSFHPGLADSPPNNDATESVFHPFWDAN